MKDFIKTIAPFLISLAILVGGFSVYAASITPVFPTSLNNFSEGDVIEEEDWNAIELTIGETSTTSKATLHGKWNDLFASTTMPQITTLLNLTSTGALNAGSITSGFGSIDLGSDVFTTTGLGTFGGFISTASSTVIGNFTITGNSTTTNATTTAFAISSLSSAVLKVDGNGSVLEAVDGTDYVSSVTGDWTGTLDGIEGANFLRSDVADTSAGLITFTSGFISNASSTQIGDFNIVGNATATNATTTSFFSTTASTTNFYVGSLFGFFGQVWQSLSDFSTYIYTLFSGGEGITFSSGAISFDCSEVTDSAGDGLTCSGENLVVATEAGSYGAATIDGDDINSNLAGRSLTLTSASPDTLDIDSEIFTYSIAANLVATTTADGIATTTEDFLSVRIPTASTITRIDCYADTTGTSTVKASYASNPLSAGTQVVSAGTTCGSQALTAVTSFNNSTPSAGDWLRVWVSDAEPTGSRPAKIYFTLTLTKDD